MPRNSGVVGWGAYVPRYRIKMEEIARVWGWEPSVPKGLGVVEKAIAGPDEDSLTMGYEAALNAIRRAGVDPAEIKAVFFGSESKPYAVKPAATIIADALGISPETMASDLEFACRAGSEGLRAALALVEAGYMRYALAIGSDTAQANPGNVLEFTAASGAAAFVVGPASESVAVLEGVYTYVTDTPDFWRGAHSKYPLHGEGFTGEPAYFAHIIGAVKGLMENLGLRPEDFDYAIFHQPNGKFPLRVGARLGIPKEKILPGLVTPVIGNTYNGSALIGFARVLDQAKPGQRILVAPFGSGAGSDAYSFVVTDKVEERRDKAPKVDDYINRKKYVDYGLYAKMRGIIERILE
ncbi:hydroxymethylglutaryl-CoA synthase [Pyrofollis japonicus]|uniref:hydroxymethylglutaryl-CoA synthase n=1 Tax=Pyrofollis japonicus TaxID=3060460 RepID=UPI00295B777F|nr:hydroxymethylglutaryl-CoA synthase [Pyrofollis japonicus]BEP16758.1 hydroxymethylglutaryl-CoA synthase [Pyrofollis japonicus]